ncbi:MAG: HK97 family phage prohead protease [Polynucleobacter sp.]
MIAPTLDKSKREQLSFEIRELSIVNEDGGTRKISGYASVWDKPSYPIGGPRGFVERVKRGAFTETLKDGRNDTIILWHHNPMYIVGRRSVNTLTLREDDKGLYFEAIPPNTTWANDLAISMDRGDIASMSIGFNTVRDFWSPDGSKRDLLEVKLPEISITGTPAYPSTSASIRALANGMNLDAFEEMISQLERGEALDNDTNLRYIEIVEYFRSLGEPGAEPVPDDNQPGAEPVDLDEWRKLVMDSDLALAGFKV